MRHNPNRQTSIAPKLGVRVTSAPGTLVPEKQAPIAPPAKMSHLEFCVKAIQKLRKGDYKGIHTVYSGFNSAFKAYFGEGSDPVETTKALVAEGKLFSHFAKGGVMLYLPNEAPAKKDDSAQKALAAILS